MTLKSTIKDSISLLIKKPKLIHAAFLMTFGHTIVYVFFIAYFFNSIISMQYNAGINVSEALIYIFNTIQELNILAVIITFILIALIGYFYIYPVAEATLISTMKEWGNNLAKALNQGLKKFFYMLEYRSLSAFLGVYTIITVTIRLRVMGILESIIIKPIIIIRLISSLFTIIFRPYLKFYVVLKDIPVFDAMKKSVLLTLGNFRLTLKALCMDFFFMGKLFLNAILIAILPIGVFYGAVTFWLIEYKAVEIILRSIVWIALLLITYLNSIYEAFLINFWYHIFETAEERMN